MVQLDGWSRQLATEILDQFFLNTSPKAAPAPISNHMAYIAFIRYLCQPIEFSFILILRAVKKDPPLLQ